MPEIPEGIPRIIFDYFNLAEIPTFILCNPNKEQLFALGGISERVYSAKFNALSELSFRADEYVDNIYMPYYEYLVYKKLVFVDSIGYFVIIGVTETNNGIIKYKEVTCESLETILNNKRLVVYTSGSTSTLAPVKLHDLLLDLENKYMPDWSHSGVPGMVYPPSFISYPPLIPGGGGYYRGGESNENDTGIASDYRSFDVSDKTIYDFLMTEVEEAYGCVFDFDTVNQVINIYDPDETISETDIYLSYDNLVKQLTVEQVTDEMSTVLNVHGGNGLDILYANPLGSNDIYNLTYFKNTTWMDTDLITAIDTWEQKVYAQENGGEDSYKGHALTLLQLGTTAASQATILTYYTGCLAYLEQVQAGYIEAYNQNPNSQTAQAVFDINQKVLSVSASVVSASAALKNTEDDMNDEVESLSLIADDLSISGSENVNFTNTQMMQLQPFILQSSYVNDNIIITDNMAASSVMQQSQKLYTQAKDILAKTSVPKYTFEVNSVNFLQIKEFEKFRDQLALGASITLEINNTTSVSPILLSMDMNFDNPDDFSLTFGNRMRIDDESYKFTDIMGKALEAGNTNKLNSYQWGDWANNYKNQVGTFVNSQINAANNQIVSGSEMQIIINPAGLKTKRRKTDGTYEPEQLWIINNTIYKTIDGWNTVESLVGNVQGQQEQISIDGTTTENVSVAGYGLSAKAIIGEITATSVSASGVKSGSINLVNILGDRGKLITTGTGDLTLSACPTREVLVTAASQVVIYSDDSIDLIAPSLLWNSTPLPGTGGTVSPASISAGSMNNVNVLGPRGKLIVSGSGVEGASEFYPLLLSACPSYNIELLSGCAIILNSSSSKVIMEGTELTFNGSQVYKKHDNVTYGTGNFTNLTAEDNTNIGKGLYVGSTLLAPDDGSINVSGSVKLSGGLYVGNKAGTVTPTNAIIDGLTYSGSITSRWKLTGSIIAGSTVSASNVFVNYNVVAGSNISAFGVAVTGSITALGSITGSVITGSTITGSTINATVLNVNTLNTTSIAITGNITSTGTISGLNISGSTIISTGSLSASYITAKSTITGSIITGSTITGSTIIGTTSISTDGLLTGAYISTTGSINAGSAVIAGGFVTGGSLVATGCIRAQTVIASASVIAGGSIVGLNIIGTNSINTSGLLSGAYLSTTGSINAGSAVTAGGFITGGSLVASGCIRAQTIIASASIVAGGSITGLNIIGTNSVNTSGLLSGAYISSTGSINAGSAVTAGGFITGGSLVATGCLRAQTVIASASVIAGGSIVGLNIVGTNSINTTGLLSGAYISTTGSINATGSITSSACITGLNFITGGSVIATGCVRGQTIVASASVIAGGSIVGLNIIGTNSINTSGLLSGAYLSTSGSINAGSAVTGGGFITGGSLVATGCLRAQTIIASASVIAGGSIVGLNLVGTNSINTNGLLSGAYISTTGSITASGSINAPSVETDIVSSIYINTRYLKNNPSISDDTTLSPVGNITVNPSGSYLYPDNNYDINLGMLNKKWLTIHGAELWVETLVAQNTMATIGGRVLVAPTTTLTRDLLVAGSSIFVKHEILQDGDRIYLESNGKLEWLSIEGSGGLVGTDEYLYDVARNLDGSGANDWYAGDAVLNTGQAGDGYIDLYSINSISASTTQFGPTITGNVRNSDTFNDISEAWAIGNLNGLYGVGGDTYGAGFGKYANSQSFIVIEPNNGIRMLYRDGSGNVYTTAQWYKSGSIRVGNQTDGEYIDISSTGINLYGNATKNFAVTSTGSVVVGNQSSGEYVDISSTGIDLYGGGTKNIAITSAGSVVVGNQTDGEYVDISNTGINLYGNATKRLAITSAGSIVIGDDSTNGEYIDISNTGINLYGNSTKNLAITSAGSIVLGYMPSGEYIDISVLGVNLYNNNTKNLALTSAGSVVIGDQTSGEYIDISSKGINLYSNNTENISVTPTGSIVIGYMGSGSYITLSNNGIDMYVNNIKRFDITSPGNLNINNSLGTPVITLNSSGSAYIADKLIIGSGGSIIAYGATGDNLVINGQGITLSASSTNLEKIKWIGNTNSVSHIYSSTYVNEVEGGKGSSTYDTTLYIESRGITTGCAGRIELVASRFSAGNDVESIAELSSQNGLYVSTLEGGNSDITADGTIRGNQGVKSSTTISASGGLYLGNANGTIPSGGNIIATGSISLDGGIQVGDSTKTATPGTIIATGSGKFAKGLTVGGTGDVAEGDIIATSDGRFGGGLYIGSTATNPATGEIEATGDITTYADEVGLTRKARSWNYDVEEFTGTSLPAGWAWAGSPFTTPTVTVASSVLDVTYSTTANDRHFLYKSGSSTSNIYCLGALHTTIASTGFGCRMDDGSDNNYVEINYYYTSAMTYDVKVKYRTGGGTVTETAGAKTFVYSGIRLFGYIAGSKWSSWYLACYYGMPFFPRYAYTGLSSATGQTWTPTRTGLIFNKGNSTSGGQVANIDWFSYT